MVRLIRACSYSDYQISMTIRNATDFFRCWTGFPTRYFSISDSKNRAAAVWKTALTGAWGSASTSRKPSVPRKQNGWFFAFVYTNALLATIVKATKNSPLFHFFLAASNASVSTNLAATKVASNAYGAPYAKPAHFCFGGSVRFLLVGKSPKPFESQVPCELRTLRTLS